ncbi:MAG TPA: hypothetical protein VE127_10410, partial [Solirubrobacteraceae bacterium]|nr:hypothetical protein [Solirubrobacteraceae bacterium]
DRVVDRLVASPGEAEVAAQGGAVVVVSRQDVDRCGEPLEQLAAGPGDIVIVPPDTPHKFTNQGVGRSKLVCIHANPTFETEWLE